MGKFGSANGRALNRRRLAMGVLCWASLLPGAAGPARRSTAPSQAPALRRPGRIGRRPGRLPCPNPPPPGGVQAPATAPPGGLPRRAVAAVAPGRFGPEGDPPGAGAGRLGLVCRIASTAGHSVPARCGGTGPRTPDRAVVATPGATGRQGCRRADRDRQRARGRDQPGRGPVADHPDPSRAQPDRHLQSPGRGHRGAQRPAEFAAVERPGDHVGHDDLDPLGRDRASAHVPGPGHHRHPGPGGRGSARRSPGPMSRSGRSGPRSSWTGRSPTPRPCPTSSRWSPRR